MLLLALALLQGSPVAEKTGTIRSRRLDESSGIVVSAAHRGVLWSHNDSGDGPYLYATDLTGRDRGGLLVPGADAIDWEDMAPGPCPPPLPRARTCLFIGDTGDNPESRASATVYAVPEPEPPVAPSDTQRTTGAPRALHLRYADGPRDVEAIFVSPRTGDLFLVSKGRSGPIRVYRVERAAWGTDTVVTATRIQELAIRSGRGPGPWVTGAAIRPDGRLVAVRTEHEIFFFTPGVGGRLVPTTRPRCPIRGLQVQGEAVAFLDDSTLVLTSEAAGGRSATIHTVRCP